MLPKSLKAGISEAAVFTRQLASVYPTAHLVGSISAATELLDKVSSIQAAKTLLKIER
jgi:hypothetical protein